MTIREPLATTLMPMYSAVADTGVLVHALLRAAPGKKLIAVNEWIDVSQFARMLAKVLGKDIEFVDSNPNFSMGDPDLEKDYADMIQFCVEFGFDGGKVDNSVLQPSDLGVPFQLESVKQWISKQEWEKAVEIV